jgi:hypothetical protein
MTEPTPKRDWTPREMRLVAEYAARTWPEGGYWTNFRLGPPIVRDAGRFASDAEARMASQAFRRWVDLLVVEPHRLIVCEAKIVAAPGALAQIEVYLDLVAATPELAPYSDRPAVGMFLCAVPDPTVTALATRKGFEVVVFHPPWVDEFMLILERRERRAPTQTVYGPTEGGGS